MAVRKRAEMQAETRARLVRSARAAFAAKGYAGASMDELTADAGLTRGALYHNFGDKRGLLQAVIDEIDAEMLARMREVGARERNAWDALIAEAEHYIRLSLEPEIGRIVHLDGPAVLGDPSRWPNQSGCIRTTADTIRTLVDEGTVAPVDPEAASRLLNGAALNAALWIAASDDPPALLPGALDAFRRLASGLLRDPAAAPPA